MKKKTLALLLSVVLVISIAVGGSLAWLTAEPVAVTNTFVAGQIGTLALTETDTDQETTGEQHQYIVIPGVDIHKDPKVTYTPVEPDGDKTPVDAYVFVQLSQPAEATAKWTYENGKYVIKSGTPASVVMSFEIADGADGWTKLDGQDVFYREVKATDSKLDPVSIIKGDTIDVSSAITKVDVETVASAADKLTFKAYAIQQASGDADNNGKFEPAEAWAKVTEETAGN